MWVALVIERGRNMRCVGCMVFTYMCIGDGGVCVWEGWIGERGVPVLSA